MVRKKIVIYKASEISKEMHDEYSSMETSNVGELNYVIKVRPNRERVFITDTCIYSRSKREDLNYSISEMKNAKVGLAVNIVTLIMGLFIMFGVNIYCANHLIGLAEACREANADYCKAQHDYEVNVEAVAREHAGTLEGTINWFRENEEWIEPYDDARNSAELRQFQCQNEYDSFKEEIPSIKRIALLLGIMVICFSIRMKLKIEFQTNKKIEGLLKLGNVKVAQEMVKELSKNVEEKSSDVIG